MAPVHSYTTMRLYQKCLLYIVPLFLLLPSTAFADSWEVSGGASTTGNLGPAVDTNGCYAAVPDGSDPSNPSSTKVFKVTLMGVDYYLQSFSGTVAVIAQGGGNYWQNTTMSGAGMYLTGTWYDGNGGATPVPTFTYFSSTNDCTSPPPPPATNTTIHPFASIYALSAISIIMVGVLVFFSIFWMIMFAVFWGIRLFYRVILRVFNYD